MTMLRHKFEKVTLVAVFPDNMETELCEKFFLANYDNNPYEMLTKLCKSPVEYAGIILNNHPKSPK